MKEVSDVLQRVAQLRQLHSVRETEKETLRAVMAGSDEGLKAILGDLGGLSAYQVPSANLVLSGLTRLGQKIGRIPDLRVDPPRDKDGESYRAKAEKRARIVAAKDSEDRLVRVLNKTALHLPGYGFAAWLVKERVSESGQKYGGLERLDSYSTYPGQAFGDEAPPDLATVYFKSVRDLVRMYPQHTAKLYGTRAGGGIVLEPGLWGGGSTYGASPTSQGSGLEVVEYYDRDGCWVVVPARGLLLEFYPNPLSSPQFKVMERYTLDRLVGHYDHVIGLQAQIARFNALASMAMEDAVFAETNVTGELVSGQYRRGRFAVNYLTPGSQVNRPVANVPYQMFQEQDRLERQFRTTAGYAVTDDAVSPAAQATGQGIDRLNQGIDMEVKQYLGIIREGLEWADRKRLEWDEVCYPDAEMKIRGTRGGRDFEESYVPKTHIAGNYSTRRTYGAMAGLDDSQKVVGLLQLKQGDLIDQLSAMEELDLGGRSVLEVRERIEEDKVRRTLMEMMATGAQVDPRTAMTLIAMLPEGEFKTQAEKFWTPQGESPSPEEEAMLAPPVAGPQGPPPPVADVMAMLAQGGGPPGAGMPMPAGAVA